MKQIKATYNICILGLRRTREEMIDRFHVTDRGNEAKTIFMKVRDMVNSRERWLHLF